MGNKSAKSNISLKKSKLKEFWANPSNLDFWKETSRPRALEILTALCFLSGVTLTTLIASGVLLWGPIGLGICATLGFLGASHLLGTESWTENYYIGDVGDSWINNSGNGFGYFIKILKVDIFPPIFFLGGVSLVVLGGMGIMGLGLGLGLGISSIVATSARLINFFSDDDDKEDFKRGVWISYVAVVGTLATATFLFLGFAGILAWSSVLAFGAPAAIPAIAVPIVGILIKSTDWIKFRTKTEELLEPILFFGGTTLTVLISLGILPFGGVGIAICSMLTFFSASRFLATNSWSNDHNFSQNANNPKSIGLVQDNKYDDVSPIKRIFSIIGILAGIVLPVFGAVGVFGLGFGFALGVPIFSASVIGLASIKMYEDNKNENHKSEYQVDESDNVWSVFTAILGVIATGMSLCLGLGGVLALPISIAIAVPSAVFAVLIGLIHLAMFYLSKTGPESCKWLKEIFSDGDESGLVVGFLGIGRYSIKSAYPKELKVKDNTYSHISLQK